MGEYLLCGQEKRTEISVSYRVNSTRIDTTYSGNSEKIRQIHDTLEYILNDTTVNVLGVSFCGTASPEGSYQVNRRLARARLKTLEDLICGRIGVPDSLVTRNDGYIPWNMLVEMMHESGVPYAEQVTDIINGEFSLVGYYNGQQVDSRITEIRKLEGGRVWQDMNRRFFSKMRIASVVMTTERRVPPQLPELDAELEPTPEPEVRDTFPPVTPEPEIEPLPEPESWSRKLYVKTNAVGLGMAVTNAAAEIDICRHLSFNLPVYYSAWNYFTETIKFRTLFTQPELRFWLNENNDGFFLGAHFGVGSYNVAVDGEYRIQDHDGVRPALGGGLGLGYRMPLSKKNPRWKVEFNLGAGVYSLKHDFFHNYENGLMTGTEKKTYIGPDMAAVSFMYMFDLKKKNKEGRR